MVFEPLKELKHILLRLLNGDIVHRDVGICGHAKNYWNESLGEYCTYHGYCEDLPYSSTSVDQFMGILMSTWPAGTGDPHFPVPCDTGNCDTNLFDAYELCTDKWEGEQHELRINLLNFLIEEIDSLIENQGNKDEI